MAVMDKNEERSDKNENSKEQAPTEDGSLESFITKHYELQKATRICITAWMGLKFNQISPLTRELPALVLLIGSYSFLQDAGKMEATDELCDERTADFFARAISESRRMNSEVQKSDRKLDALHQEFGQELVNSWQAEHASEVLQPHEAELVKRANYQS